MAKEQIWNGKWRQLEHLGKGGQGLTYLTQAIEGDENRYVLKILKDQKNPNKRGRLYREVAAYKTLNFQGIPKLIDTNAEKFEGADPLFLITEFIPGLTLEAFINENGPLDLQQALIVVSNLLNIVEYSHSADVVHRDIKPDNIILRENDINQLYLIDFGLSFNKEIAERITPSSEQLTNRFLHLPELNNQEAKTDYRTDITYTVAIFFYVLTGEYPQDLTDHDNSMPHQRKGVQPILAKVADTKLNLLQSVFDRAFATHIDYRYQSIAALREDLKRLSEHKEKDEADLELRLQDFKEKVKRSVDGDKRYSIRKLFEQVHNNHSNTINELAKELGWDSFGTIQTGMKYDYDRFIHNNKLGIRSILDPDKKSIWPHFTASVTGSEIIFQLNDQGDEETFRMPVSDIDWLQVNDFIRNFFLKRLHKLG